MRYLPSRVGLVLAILTTALTLGVAGVSADCGGGPCTCASEVTSNTTLNPKVDPVCFDVCVEFGLLIATPGVTLNLGSCTIRGAEGLAGSAVAVLADEVTVSGGRILGFDFAAIFVDDRASNVRLTGLQIFDGNSPGLLVRGRGHTIEKSVIRRRGEACVVSTASGTTMSGLQISDCVGAGLTVSGEDNTVERTVVLRAGADGILVQGVPDGLGSTVRSNQVRGNQGAGIAVLTGPSVVAGNAAQNNAACGISVLAAQPNTVERNQANNNGAGGICLEGFGHTVSLNSAGGNGPGGSGSGIFVHGATGGIAFDRNRSTNNSEFGIEDESVGAGTGGTANTYTNNRCGTGNGTAPSSPAGLCN